MKKLLILFMIFWSLLIISCDDNGSKPEHQICGNQIQEGNEICDGTDLNGITCVTVDGTKFVAGILKCHDSCQKFITTECVTEGTVCGDGILNGEEDCDGDIMPMDYSCYKFDYAGGVLGCDETCHFDFSQCLEFENECGDGEVENSEECDGVNLNGFSCEIIGYYGGTLSCNSNCQFDVTGCEEGGFCGDGLIQENELCDSNNLNGQSCGSFGYHGGLLSCSSDCTYNISSCTAEGMCGDGLVQENYNEQCDSSSLNESTCETLGYYGGNLDCNSDCSFNLTQCLSAGWCGDGLVQESRESCDGSQLNNLNCEDLGYYGGELSCNSDCSYNLTSCANEGLCGDNIIQDIYNEECDGNNLGGLSCQDYGYHNGILSCSDCQLNFSGCEPYGQCGDSIIQSNEQCEQGDLQGETCNSLGYSSGILSCSYPECTFDTSSCIP